MNYEKRNIIQGVQKISGWTFGIVKMSIILKRIYIKNTSLRDRILRF